MRPPAASAHGALRRECPYLLGRENERKGRGRRKWVRREREEIKGRERKGRSEEGDTVGKGREISGSDIAIME